MNSIFAKIIGLLPLFITGAEQISADIKGSDKKKAVTDALSAVAVGVASTTPEHAQAATAAATTAINAIDGVVEVMKLTGALPAKATLISSGAITASSLNSTNGPAIAQQRTGRPQGRPKLLFS